VSQASARERAQVRSSLVCCLRLQGLTAIGRATLMLKEGCLGHFCPGTATVLRTASSPGSNLDRQGGGRGCAPASSKPVRGGLLRAREGRHPHRVDAAWHELDAGGLQHILRGAQDQTRPANVSLWCVLQTARAISLSLRLRLRSDTNPAKRHAHPCVPTRNRRAVPLSVRDANRRETEGK
jgi:hypothetical protein